MPKRLTSDEAFEKWLAECLKLPFVKETVAAPGVKPLLKLAWIAGHEDGWEAGGEDAERTMEENA